jgi:hypothetical protein
MYTDITASRAHQHRAAFEKHAQAARQVKIARAAAPRPNAVAAQRLPRFSGWTVPALARRVRPVGQPAPRPVTV